MTLSEKALTAADLVRSMVEIGQDWERCGPEEAMRIRSSLSKAIADLRDVHARLWPFPQYPETDPNA